MAEPLNIPDFENEEQEAAWWPTQESVLVARLEEQIAAGRVRRFNPETFLGEECALIPMGADDAQKATALARKSGVSASEYLRDLVHETLNERAARSA